LIKDDEHVVVIGVSGGPDSVALLHILLHLQLEMGITLVAAYINHGLRPVESEVEEDFVRSMSKDLGVLYDSVQVNVREHAKQEKISLEHAARDLRYKALREIASKHEASLITVAHTADDQAEEILIRLLRGSGMKGLSGMRNRAGDIIRPMLSLDKDTILRYLDDKKISFCMDSSNTDMRFVRNRVRHKLIPFLEDTFDQGIRSSLCKTADSLAEDEKLLDDLTVKAVREVLVSSDIEVGQGGPRLVLDRKKLTELPIALQRRTIEQILWKLHCKASYTHIMKIVEAAGNGKTGTEIHLSRGLRVGVQRECLEFLYPQGQSSWRGRLYSRK
jgi:tRNA(Ile)-lysidine synthase